MARKTAGEFDCTGKIGVVGFCYGGGIANLLATRVPDLGAAVPFYGSQPAAAEVGKIRAPLLIHYAENDERINTGWPAYEAALKANNVKYAIHHNLFMSHYARVPGRSSHCSLADLRLAYRNYRTYNVGT